MIGGVNWIRPRRWTRGAALATLAAACTPSSAPVWVLSQPRELGLRLDLRAPGPYSDDLDPNDPASPSEFLPGDTVEVTPLVAGPDGPIAPGDLQALWFLCDDAASCLLRGDRLEDAPACDDEPLAGPQRPCLLGGQPTASWIVGEPPPPMMIAPGDDVADAAIDVATSWPFVGMIASPPDGPGAEACRQALDRRTSLEDCLLAERSIPLGPLSAVADVLGPLGYDVDFSESLGPLLQRPRNHNPEVEVFNVTIAGESTTVRSAETIAVPPGSEVRVSWIPSADDVESFDIMLPEAPMPSTVTESLGGRWYVSEEVEGYTALDDGWTLELVAPRRGQTHLHLLLRDDRGSETSGWLILESSAS